MTTRFRALLALLALLVTPYWLSAQDSAALVPPPVRIQGNVLDTAGNPIPWATVTAYNASDSLINGAVTNTQGAFDFSTNEKPTTIRIACMGFETLHLPYGQLRATSTLSPETLAIDEVRVEAKQPTVQLTGNAVSVKVQGTTLERETSLLNMLSKIPGLVKKDESIQTVVGGTPAIFLNGRRVMSLDEIASLDVKSVRSVKYESQPGPKYGSDVMAVIDIQTESLLEGFALTAKHRSKVNHNYSHDNSLNLNYTASKFSLYAGGSFADNRLFMRQKIQQIIALPGDTTRLNTDVESPRRLGRNGQWNVAADYTPSQRLSTGVKYVGRHETTKDQSTSSTLARLQSGLESRVEGVNRTMDVTLSHHVNAYLQAMPGTGWQTNLYVDFYHSSSSRTQDVLESRGGLAPSQLDFASSSKYAMLAVKPIASYQLTPTQSIEAGAEYTYVYGIGIQDKSLPGNEDYTTTESTLGPFASYSIYVAPVSIKAGLRYEYADRRLIYAPRPQAPILAPTSNLFGHFSLSAALGKTQHSLSFRSSIQRPNFSLLNSNSYYLDAFISNLNNPELRPALSYIGVYTFFWKFIYFNLNYTYTRDALLQYLNPDPNKPNAMVAGTMNYYEYQQLHAVLNMKYKWGFYSPNLTFATIYSAVYDPVAATRSFDRTPMFYLDFNNEFELPWRLFLNLQYTFNSGGMIQLYRLKPTHLLNVRLQRSFLNNSLDVAISGNDLLNLGRLTTDALMPQISIHQVTSFDTRYVSLDITWRFNQMKSQYRGQSTEAIERL